MTKKKVQQVLPLTPQGTLMSLLNTHRRTRNKVGELNDEASTAISNAVENKHLHRGAFNFVKRLYVMQDEKLAELMYHLEAYFDDSGINERVAKVGRLPLDDNGDGKVVSIKSNEKAAEAAE